MKKFIATLLLLFICSPILLSQESNHNTDSLLIANIKAMIKVGHPIGGNYTLIEHAAMFIGFSCSQTLPGWVYHIIPPEIVNGSIARTNNFRDDSLISCPVGTRDDYFSTYYKNGKKRYNGYGYDRGHLAPAADFKWSKKAVSESFLYTNMTPQLPDFNRKSWAFLERSVRELVTDDPQDYYIVTGPILHDYQDTIQQGPHHLKVPHYFFKTILKLGRHPQAIGFIVPNKEFPTDLSLYAVSVDSVEKVTGLNLYPKVRKSLQDSIEAICDFKNWHFRRHKNDVSPLDPAQLPKNVYNTKQAKKLIGKTASVVGKVVSIKQLKRGTTLMNLDYSFPNKIFTVVIFGSDQSNFPYSLKKFWKGKYIKVTGKIKNYKGTPEIIVHSVNQIQAFHTK